MGVGSLPISCSNESDVECAGSEETISVLKPRSAAQMAVAAEVVVFPTPPFPPNKISLLMGRATGVFLK